MKHKKSARKYAASGKLKQAIQARHKHQKLKKQIERRKGSRKSDGKFQSSDQRPTHGDEEEEEEEESTMHKGKNAKNAVEFDGSSDEGGLGGGDDVSDESEASDDEDGSFASVDDLEDEDDGATHLVQLSKLAEKDPEFYKYLQENDKELLEFNLDEKMDGISDDDMEVGIPSGDEDEDEGTPTLTLEILRGWQKAILEHRSLRALRKLLVAFRAASYTNDEEANVAWIINNSTVFDKVVTTALKYTPLVLDHHIPYRKLQNGRYKPPLQSPKQQTLTRLVSTFFMSILRLLSQITDPQLLVTCLVESANLVPYIVGNRRVVKAYLKTCLGLWSSPNIDTKDEMETEDQDDSGSDKVRISAFLCIRKVALGSDESLLEMVLKGTYTTFLRNCKSTSVHSLPAINLMKNTGADIYSINLATSYQHAFGYIRQLAVTLRNTLKAKPASSKESEKSGQGKSKKSSGEPYKQVYNWQFVHAVDFWSQLLSRNCESDSESELRPLIYPLVQVTLGVVKLVPTVRYYPLHLHLISSLLDLSRHTHTYIPLPPYLLAILTSLVSITKPKPSTLKPLDLEVIIRVPTSYLKTRVLLDNIIDEVIYLLSEWGAGVQNSIAFPELIVPVLVSLKRCIKITKQSGHRGKGSGSGGDERPTKAIKTLIERLEEGREWVQERRKHVGFAPNDRSQVDKWQNAVKVGETPVGKYAAVLKKTRERNRKLLEKARRGEEEYLRQ
ncbi:Nucleolar Complex 2 protein [Serendipita sp. 398]|nr:Nucleolar Complex 2 protein [Serendipita sp. 398]